MVFLVNGMNNFLKMFRLEEEAELLGFINNEMSNI